MRVRVLLVTMASSRAKVEKCKCWESIGGLFCTYCEDGVGDVKAWKRKKEMGNRDRYYEN